MRPIVRTVAAMVAVAETVNLNKKERRLAMKRSHKNLASLWLALTTLFVPSLAYADEKSEVLASMKKFIMDYALPPYYQEHTWLAVAITLFTLVALLRLKWLRKIVSLGGGLGLVLTICAGIYFGGWAALEWVIDQMGVAFIVIPIVVVVGFLRWGWFGKFLNHMGNFLGWLKHLGFSTITSSHGAHAHAEAPKEEGHGHEKGGGGLAEIGWPAWVGGLLAAGFINGRYVSNEENHFAGTKIMVAVGLGLLGWDWYRRRHPEGSVVCKHLVDRHGQKLPCGRVILHDQEFCECGAENSHFKWDCKSCDKKGIDPHRKNCPQCKAPRHKAEQEWKCGAPVKGKGGKNAACGHVNDVASKVCQSCGAPNTPWTCAHCHKKGIPGKFYRCPESDCGKERDSQPITTATVLCPHCGKQSRAGGHCQYCGKPLTRQTHQPDSKPADTSRQLPPADGSGRRRSRV